MTCPYLLFAVIMVRPMLKHCLPKAMPACHHEHPSLVPKKGACMMEGYGGMMNGVHVVLQE
jgi:hypothetical protein